MKLLLILILVLAGALLYLRFGGLPAFVKTQLEDSLRVRGIALRLGSLRLKGLSGIMGDNIEFARVRPLGGPTGHVAHFELLFDRTALRRFEVRPQSLILKQVEVLWSLDPTNARPEQPILEDLTLEAHFPRPNQLEVPQLSGHFLSADVEGSLSITNVSAIISWPLWGARVKTSDWQTRARDWLVRIQNLKVTPPCSIRLQLRGNGRDPDSFQAECRVESWKARWEENSVERLRLELTAAPASVPFGESQVKMLLSAKQASTPWAHGQGITLSGQGAGSLSNQTMRSLAWQFRAAEFTSAATTGYNIHVSATTRAATNEARRFRTNFDVEMPLFHANWGTAQTNHLQVELSHGRNRSELWQAQWQLNSGPVTSRWGAVTFAQGAGKLAPSARDSSAEKPDAAWGIWERVEPFHLDWQIELDQVRLPKVEADKLICAGVWDSPNVFLQNLHAELYGGKLDATGRLNVPSREVRAEAAFDFEAHRISPLLTTNSQRWLDQFTWQRPPVVSAAARMVLPVWTNAHPNWREEVMPSIELTGEFSGNQGAFRGVEVDRAHSHFALTNMIWYLPDLSLETTNAVGTLGYVGDMQSHDYRWLVDARINPQLVKPLLENEGASRVLDQFEFSGPPTVQGEVWGRWHDPSSVRFKGHVAATNFTFRGEQCGEFSAAANLTESALHFTNVLIRREAQQITVPVGRFDFIERVVYVTNAISTMDPNLITTVIGPKVHEAIQPYQFESPPTVRVNGRLPTVDVEDADVRFEVVGESFHYWKLRAANIIGDVHWCGNILSISNVQASVYGGDLTWHGQFDFSVPVGANLEFEGAVRNANLHALMADLGRKTNKLEGTLEGRVQITSANSDDWRSWQGSGRVRLRDGFLWDIPIFGFFSPVLNKIVPGLGNVPISAGDATFRIDESVVDTSDLELKSPALRLRYNGTVDFKGKVDARLQAQILRDAWGVGRALSWALWPLSKVFEYKIKGTVDQPKSEPVFIPKMFLWPLHPIQTLKKFFVRDAKPPKPEPEQNVPTTTLEP